MRHTLVLLRALLAGLLVVANTPTFACDIIMPKRDPTVAEQMAGLSIIFGGTVVGWELENGKRLTAPMPSACLQDGKYYWYDNQMQRKCKVYLDTSAALFRVDTPIVGPAADAIVPVYMTWGDGDCNIDFNWGEQWFIAGDESEGKVHSDLLSRASQQVLREPIRADEIAALRKMGAEPKFDFNTLYK